MTPFSLAMSQLRENTLQGKANGILYQKADIVQETLC